MWNGKLVEEEITSVDRGFFLRGMMWSSFGNLVAMVVSLLTVMFAVRILDKTEMGAYFLVMVIAQFAITLGDFGLRNTSVKVLSAGGTDRKTTISQHLLTLRLLAALLTCVVLALLLPLFLGLWRSQEFARIAWLTLPVTFLMMMFQMGLALFIGHHRFRQFSKVNAMMEERPLFVW